MFCGKQADRPLGVDLTTNRRTVEYLRRRRTEFRRMESLRSVFKAVKIGRIPSFDIQYSIFSIRYSPLALDPFHVGAGAGIDFQQLSFFDKGRHLQDIACFQGCRF